MKMETTRPEGLARKADENGWDINEDFRERMNLCLIWVGKSNSDEVSVGGKSL